jgi:hypothetical protein
MNSVFYYDKMELIFLMNLALKKSKEKRVERENRFKFVVVNFNI